jgi:hypothetical protein
VTSSSGDISRERCTKRHQGLDDGLETEHQGRRSSNFSHHIAKNDAEFAETLAGKC